jgi:hypothetical protein
MDATQKVHERLKSGHQKEVRGLGEELAELREARMRAATAS